MTKYHLDVREDIISKTFEELTENEKVIILEKCLEAAKKEYFDFLKSFVEGTQAYTTREILYIQLRATKVGAILEDNEIFLKAVLDGGKAIMQQLTDYAEKTLKNPQ